MKNVKAKVKEILLRQETYDVFDESIPTKKRPQVEKKENLSKEQYFKNIKDAINVKYSIEDEYEKISPVKRFFSHLLPNKWTKAGQLRDQINECKDAFKEAKFEKKDIEEHYIKEFGSDIADANAIAKIKKNYFFTKSQEKALRQYALDHKIAPSIDLTETGVKNGSTDLEEENDDREIPDFDEDEVEENKEVSKQENDTTKREPLDIEDDIKKREVPDFDEDEVETENNLENNPELEETTIK